VNIKIFELNHGAYILNDTLSKLSVILSSNSGQNQELRQKIALVRENLIFIQDRTENITETMMELNSSVDKFLGDIIRVTDELNKTIDVLDAYTKKDPSSILRPVRIEEKPVFKEKLEIFYRLPSLVSIILLFITLFIASSLVVNERKGGTMARIFLSPISMFFYVFEKMIYLLVLSIMAALSMLVATLIFKVPMEMDPQLLVVTVVASLVYISIGMFVGSVSKSENTSLLTCLVVGFPLMFLCGAFSPPELMSKFMRIVSAYLPLTMNISLIEKITIYHTGIDLQMILIMLGIVAVFYVASVLLIRKNPTLK